MNGFEPVYDQVRGDKRVGGNRIICNIVQGVEQDSGMVNLSLLVDASYA